MNRPGRSITDSLSRSNSAANNIHINISLNVKQKNNCFHGKKIDNFIEVNSKPKNEAAKTNTPKQIQKIKKKVQSKKKTENSSLKSTNKKKVDKKQQKQKPKVKQFTPEKQIPQYQDMSKSKTRKQERSKSRTNKKEERSKSKTNKKSNLNKKQSKSMQNLKGHFKQKIHQYIRSNSNSREKSQNTKNIKSNTESLKKLISFQNSGIKNKIQKFQSEGQRQQRSSKASIANKFTQQEVDKIKKFMNQKKKKQKKQKIKKQNQLKERNQRIKSQLLKVQNQRRQNATKPFKKQVVSINQAQQIRLPMFFGQDDEFDQDKDYDKLKEQAEFILKSPFKSSNHNNNDSSKKKIRSISSKKKRYSLYDKFSNGKLSNSEQRSIIDKIIKIQSVWRGYKARKNLLWEINKINQDLKNTKKRIQNKQSVFWNDDQNNSIIKLQQSNNNSNSNNESQNFRNDISLPSSQQLGKQRQRFHRDRFKQVHSMQASISNYNSGKTQENNTNHKKYLQNSNSNNALKNSIQSSNISIPSVSNRQGQRQGEEISSLEHNSRYRSQIDELKRSLAQQRQKLKILQNQNNKLKQNLNLNLKSSNKQSLQQSPQQISSLQNSQSDLEVQFFQLKMPKKINESEKSQTYDQVKKQPKKQKLKITLKPDNQTNLSKEDFRKQFESYQSPSNKKIETNSVLNLKNLEEAFKQKQIYLDYKYKKSSDSYSNLLQSNIVSPRTYNIKKIELLREYQKEKKFISHKKIQAKQVAQFLSKKQQNQQNYQKEAHNKIKQNLIQQKSQQQNEQRPITRGRSKSIGGDGVAIDPPFEYSDKDKDNSSASGQQNNQKDLCRYWRDDIDDAHEKALQISRKIDQALQAEKNSQSVKSDPSQAYSSQTSSIYTQSYQIQIQNNKSKQFQLVQQKNKQVKQHKNQAQILQTEQYVIEQIFPIKQQKTIINKQLFKQIKQINQLQQNKSEGDLQSSNQQEYNLNQNQNENNFINSKHNSGSQHLEQSITQSQAQYSKNSSQVKLKGFDTRLTFIKEFCISLCEYIRSESSFRNQFISAISLPLSYDYYEFLKAYRTLLSNENDNTYDSTMNQYIYPYFKILNPKAQTITLEHFNSFNEVYEQANSQNQISTQMKNLKQHFLIAIVDIFNEALIHEKPGSIYGESLPWKCSSKNLKNNGIKYLKQQNQQLAILESQQNSFQGESLQDQKLDKIFGIAISKIIQWGSCLCGFIPQPFSNEGGDSQVMNIDQQQTAIVRQNRMAYMLQKSLLQDQQKMIDSQMEQTQVILQVAQMIIQHLEEELVQDLEQIQQARNNKCK